MNSDRVSLIVDALTAASLLIAIGVLIGAAVVANTTPERIKNG